MKKVLFAVAMAAAMCASASAYAATTIMGSLNFNGGGANYYNPANGYVPAGYGNTGSNAVLIGAGTEFGFNDGANLDTANFTETSLVLSDVVGGSGASSWTQTFTATSANFFNNIALGANTFNGLTYGVANNTLTVNWGGTSTAGTRTANFTFGGSGAVPEPATWAMMILGMAMVGAGLRLQRRPATATA